MPAPLDKRQARRRAVRRRRLTLAATVMLVVAAVIGGQATQGHSHNSRKTLAAKATTTPPTSATSSARSRGVGERNVSHGSRSHTTTTTRHQNSVSRRKQAAGASRPSGCALDLAGARRVAQSEKSAGYRVGFALRTSGGRTLADVSGDTQNYGASITKAMLLVAYLRDYAGAVSPDARQELTAMIEVSDNTAADWVYNHLKDALNDVGRVASDAGMTGFRLDSSDPVYTLGQSLITARDFAGLFAGMQSLMPASERRFGMSLLAGVQEHVGLLSAGLPGVVYSKEGWKPEPDGALDAPYVVNQAAQFSCGGARYGIAVTVGHAPDQTSAENVVQNIARAMMR